ncbi:hypothetical protein AB0N79_39930 [Streptomyces microflavus]|uniref:hypothetical protein n=1 Tax=Streptomyces microflavus TaxID=1919 RepID=UPI00342FA6E2
MVAVAALAAVAGGNSIVACDTDERDLDKKPVSQTGQRLRELTETEQDLLHAAEQILLQECMRGRGFVYQPVSRQPVPDVKIFPYIIDDPAWARRHGYGSDIERQLKKVRDEDVNQHYFQSLPENRKAPAIAAANGDRPQGLTARAPDGTEITRSSQGCQSQAQRKLYLNLESWFQARVTVDALPALRGRKVLADVKYKNAVRVWASCMHEAGHEFKDPGALRAALPPPERPLPRSKEIALAIIEVKCGQSSGLASVSRRLDRKYDRQLKNRHRSDVDAWLDFRLDALARARSVTQSDKSR